MDETPDPASNAISRSPATGALIGSCPSQTAQQVEAVLAAGPRSRSETPAHLITDMDQSVLAGPSLKRLASRPIGTVATTLTVNGGVRQLRVEPWTTLLDLLRDKLDLTGTKKGCDHGQCGACTVLVDGTRVNACLKLAVTLDGCAVTTIEGLGRPGHLHPLQAAFVERDAFQCGYCTPGQICSAQGLINEGHARTRLEVREQMSGNICRCGAYTNIVDAVLDVLGGEEAA